MVRLASSSRSPIRSKAARLEDQVIAEFGLREKQPVVAAGLLALSFGKERSESGQPFLTAGQDVARRQRIGQFLQTGWIGALQESIGALLKIDAFLAHAGGQRVVLVEAYSRGERQVGHMRTNIRPQRSSLT
jgi:hypothetical protein